MALIASGTVPTQLLEVDNSFKAAHVVQRPLEHGSGGHYRVARNVPLVVTQAANGSLFSFRWGSSTHLAIIQYIRLSCLQTAAATATIFPRFEVFVARTFTASDTAGTALTLTTNSFKKRTSHATTAVTDMRHSALAAGLTAGTRTLDADPQLVLQTQQTITTPNTVLFTVSQDMTDGVDHPIVLAQNEGLIVRGPTTVFGAAGTADLLVELAWVETQIANY